MEQAICVFFIIFFISNPPRSPPSCLLVNSHFFTINQCTVQINIIVSFELRSDRKVKLPIESNTNNLLEIRYLQYIWLF